ncbi:hypothetical protein AB9G26_08955 [Francisella philomiragia]|uniref:hypothetical protein n=1 Tax=Francisella philomiragia TaxID=28110 RepID=UPI0035171C4D
MAKHTIYISAFNQTGDTMLCSSMQLYKKSRNKKEEIDLKLTPGKYSNTEPAEYYKKWWRDLNINFSRVVNNEWVDQTKVMMTKECHKIVTKYSRHKKEYLNANSLLEKIFTKFYLINFLLKVSDP